MRRILLVAVITGTLFAATACSSSSPDPSTATPVQAAGPAVDPVGAVVIDVRTPEEFRAGHLEGAVNIDIQGQDFAGQVSALDPAGRYLVYCRSGNRSAVAVDIMRSLGFTDLTDLGGLGEASAATALAVI